ncbi:MAG TPA: transglutaminase family protein [Hansschlegelia sp.]
MIYDLALNISYHYPQDVKDARHILRVRPRAERGQRLMSARVTISPDPTETGREHDFFGNAIDHVLILPSHDALRVTMRAHVEVARPRPDLGLTPTVAEVRAAAKADRESGGGGPMHFLGDSRVVRVSEPLSSYAAETALDDMPAGEAMLALSRRIKADFDYAPGKTTVDTPLEDAFTRREGVCQDFAHIMIAALRGIGLPAAYVSGFLRTIPPPGKPRLAGADAMHAWVDVWLGPDIGWMGFDPTNAMLALDDHVVVAVGRDYGDVAPIDGVMITAGPQKTKHTVDMTPVLV